LFIHTYAGIIIIDMPIEKEDMCHVYNKLKGGFEYRTEQKTRFARNTTRKTGREENIHMRHRLIETGKQTRNGLGGHRGYYW